MLYLYFSPHHMPVSGINFSCWQLLQLLPSKLRRTYLRVCSLLIGQCYSDSSLQIGEFQWHSRVCGHWTVASLLLSEHPPMRHLRSCVSLSLFTQRDCGTSAHAETSLVEVLKKPTIHPLMVRELCVGQMLMAGKVGLKRGTKMKHQGSKKFLTLGLTPLQMRSFYIPQS